MEMEVYTKREIAYVINMLETVQDTIAMELPYGEDWDILNEVIEILAGDQE